MANDTPDAWSNKRTHPKILQLFRLESKLHPDEAISHFLGPWAVYAKQILRFHYPIEPVSNLVVISCRSGIFLPADLDNRRPPPNRKLAVLQFRKHQVSLNSAPRSFLGSIDNTVREDFS